MASQAVSPVESPRRSEAFRRQLRTFVDRHEVAWEATMGALAILYVGLGVLLDAGLVPPSLSAADPAITAVFVLEYVARLWAAGDRRRHFWGHLPDLIALVPAVRGLRVVRLVRLARVVPVLAAASGLELPAVRRLRWHVRQAQDQLDSRLVRAALAIIGSVVATSALVVTLVERPWTLEELIRSLYWAVNTVLDSGDPTYVTTPVGWVASWTLILLGLTILAVATGSIVTFFVNLALKESNGMGVAGYSNHVVLCGWNQTARELVAELRADEFSPPIVLICPAESSPAGSGVYFVRGDPRNADDLDRANIREATAAVVFPADPSDEADMRSILTALAIESVAPHVRTIVELNNSAHVEHARRAHADEVIVASQLAAHLAARTALYPGLAGLVADVVAGGEGAELYRVRLPDEYVGRSVEAAIGDLLRRHRATLLAIVRGDRSFVNPAPDLRIEPNDDALVIAESLVDLAPAHGAHDPG
jgi:voltage-gated potassium channel